MISKKSLIYIAGHKGMVGSSIVNALLKKGYKNLLLVEKKKLNLLNQTDTYNYLKKKKPKIVIIAAAKVGGIYANNKYRADFLFENLEIQNNLIFGSYKAGIKNLIFFGSSCIYPKNYLRQIKETDLLSGKLESTNEPYAVAKIAGIKLCENFNLQYKTNYKCLMPCNLFGPNDNFHKENSHFVAALIKKIADFKSKKKPIIIWGSGRPKRELLFVNDLAEACIFFMNKKCKETLINIGTNKDYSIKEIVNITLKIFNINARINFDKSKPDGVYRKKLNISTAKKLGWKSKTTYKEAIKKTYNWYIDNL